MAGKHDIELLWFSDCPNHEAARALLREVAAELSPESAIRDIDATDGRRVSRCTEAAILVEYGEGGRSDGDGTTGERRWPFSSGDELPDPPHCDRDKDRRRG